MLIIIPLKLTTYRPEDPIPMAGPGVVPVVVDDCTVLVVVVGSEVEVVVVGELVVDKVVPKQKYQRQLVFKKIRQKEFNLIIVH